MTTNTHHRLGSKVGGILALLGALWLIGDGDFTVFTALENHEPSFRIFRALWQIHLLLVCAAVSLRLWSQTTRLGNAAIERLLWTTPTLTLWGGSDGESWLGNLGNHRTQHMPVATSYSEDDDDENNDDGPLFQNAQDKIEMSSTPSSTPATPGKSSINFLQDAEVLESEKEDADARMKPNDDNVENDEMEPELDEVSNVDQFMHQQQMQLWNMALDLLLAIFITLFLFTLSSSRQQRQQQQKPPVSEGDTGLTTTNTAQAAFWDLYARIAAPTFPLLLFLFLLYRAFWPFRGARRNFWLVVSYTLGAPWFPVSFRDGFIGDILTSSVRPMQDILFTLCYILFGLQGWWSTQEYRDMMMNEVNPILGLNDSNATMIIVPEQDEASSSASFLSWADAQVPALERSWLVHTIVLPLCTASPLWWRFLQNLRQVYNEKQRWPYLGNALKYFCAAQLAMFGMFHPEQTHSVAYLTCFVAATLYQIWWDVFMDWELLIPTATAWGLRSRRLYKSTTFYWFILWINVLLRFCWTLSFVPLRYLNTMGNLTENHLFFFLTVGGPRDQSYWASHILGPLLASAEIVRRTLWGFLRVEWEAIKTGACVSGDASTTTRGSYHDNKDPLTTTRGDIELQPMSLDQQKEDNVVWRFESDSSRHHSTKWNMSHMNPIQIIGELGVYATTFCLFCLLMAAHRGTY